MMICDIPHETLIMDGSATRTQVALRVARWLRDMGVEDAEPIARSMHWLNTDVVRDRESVEHVLHGLDRPDDAIWAVRFEHEPEIDALEAELKRERARIESELMQIRHAAHQSHATASATDRCALCAKPISGATPSACASPSSGRPSSASTLESTYSPARGTRSPAPYGRSGSEAVTDPDTAS